MVSLLQCDNTIAFEELAVNIGAAISRQYRIVLLQQHPSHNSWNDFPSWTIGGAPSVLRRVRLNENNRTSAENIPCLFERTPHNPCSPNVLPIDSPMLVTRVNALLHNIWLAETEFAQPGERENAALALGQQIMTRHGQTLVSATVHLASDLRFAHIARVCIMI